MPLGFDKMTTVKTSRTGSHRKTCTVPGHGYSEDLHGLMYTLCTWRAVDMTYINQEKPFENGVKLTPGTHAMYPRVKPFVDVKSRYL